MKWMALFVAVLYILSGAALLMYPEEISVLCCDIFGITMIVLGIINVVTYFLIDLRESLFRNDFSAGLMKILIGIMVIYYKDTFRELVPFLLGMCIISSGFNKLQDGIDASRIGYPQWWLYIILALISIVAGIAVITNLIPAGNKMLQAAGAALAYCGVSDLYSTLYISGKIKRFLEQIKKPHEPEREPKPEPVITEPKPQETKPEEKEVDWNSGTLALPRLEEPQQDEKEPFDE